MTLASNESLYAWMDEGFTDFASAEAGQSISNAPNPHSGSYAGYFSLVTSGLQEPISQHADHYTTNRAYSTGAYSMGSIFLHQLKYLIGNDNFYKGMKRYYNAWKMKHPEPNDFVRVMEKTSGLQLHWYLRYWINTTKRIDYGISGIVEQDNATFVTVDRVGEFPMPIDLVVTYQDGSKEMFYIPMNELLGNKPVEDQSIARTDLPTWPWVNPNYTIKVGRKSSEIANLEIDPSQRMADVNRKNNVVVMADRLVEFKNPTK